MAHAAPNILARKRQIPRHLSLIILIFDCLAIWLAFTTTSHLSGFMVFLTDIFGWSYDFHHFDTRRYYYVFLTLCILFYFFIKGHYSRRIPWLGQIENIFRIIGFAAMFDIFNYYFLDYFSFPFWLTFNWILCAGYLLVGRYVAFLLIRHTKSWFLPIVIVADSSVVSDCLHAFSGERFTGYDVKKILLYGGKALDVETLPKGDKDVSIYRDSNKFAQFVIDNPHYYYLFGMDQLRGDDAAALSRAIDIAGVEYGIVPHTRAFDVFGKEAHYFFGNDVMILHRRDPIYSPSGRFLKRLMDICVSGLALIFIAMVAAMVWVAKRIKKSTSPVFYGGKRVGRRGELFSCWKFCTMKEGADVLLKNILETDELAKAEWKKFKKLKNDPRVDSSVSSFLRRTSMDELPQLWNVFLGDMSLVGPRPILPEQIDNYGGKILQYNKVRPGITGLWQVNGRNETSFEQRVYWDDWYIRNWSLWYDIVIIFKTVRVLLTGYGAY